MMDKNKALKIYNYSDKLAEMGVLTSLLENPLILSDSGTHLSPDDFGEQFHKIIFTTIYNLADQGAESLSYIDIDQYLKNYPVQYKVFTDNRGSDYISKMSEYIDTEKYPYYYNRVKKFSLINSLGNRGFDIKPIYDDTILEPEKLEKMQRNFDLMRVEDILLYYDKELIEIKKDYENNADLDEGRAGDYAEELIERYKQTPEMGLPFTSGFLNTIYRGMLLGKLCIESSAQGQGKTRRQIELSSHLAVGEHYDTKRGEWVKTIETKEPVLMISIELDQDEIEPMWLASISGVPEDHILDGRYWDGEEERVHHAAKLMRDANLYFVRISDFNVDDILNIITRYHITKGVNYFFLDYLAESIKIMSESASKTKVSGLRTDQILLMYATRLKELCLKQNIFIWSATQLSGDWKSAKEADQQLLRGAKSISDKIDNGDIMLPIRESDKQIINSWKAKGFMEEPNRVLHIYKVRKGKKNNIRIYIHFDTATCRTTDCFVTDLEGHIIDMDKTDVQTIIQQTTDYSRPCDDIIDDTLDVNDEPQVSYVEKKETVITKDDIPDVNVDEVITELKETKPEKPQEKKADIFERTENLSMDDDMDF